MSRGTGLWLAAVLVVCGSVPALALDPSRAITQYAHAIWRAPQGIPHDNVSAILQGSDGYLWVGTVEGLARFDGVRSVVFDSSNTAAFKNNWVKSLAEDQQGRLWIGTLGGGLLCRDGDEFVRYDEGQGLASATISALLVGRRGQVWAGTIGAGLRVLAGQGFIVQPGTEELDHTNVRSLAQDAEGTLWIGTESGLYRLRDAQLSHFTTKEGLADDRVLALAWNSEGLWIGTERGGLQRFKDGHFRTWGVRDGLSHERVWSLITDGNGNVWIGTDGGGLDRLTEGRLSSFSSHDGLQSDFVWALHEDREGDLWIGTNGAGLHQLKDGAVKPLTTREGLPSDFTWSVERTRDGALWVGTEDAGVARRMGDESFTLTTRDGLPSNQVKAFAEAADGTVWLGTGAGVVRLDGRRIVERVQGFALRVNVLRLGPQGVLWIGAADGGVWRYEGKELTRPQSLRGATGGVSALLPARDGSLWVGTVSGLWRFQGESLRAFSTDDGLPAIYVTALIEDASSRIWVGTRGGLALVVESGLKSVGRRQGLHDDAITAMIQDGDGGLWMGGNRGLFRVGQTELVEVAFGRRSEVRSRVLGLGDGLPSLEVNGAGSSAFVDASGGVYFATRGGIAILDAQRLTPNALAPTVRIEEVMADGQALKPPYQLSAGTRRVSFRFTALGLRAPARQTFTRRLEGFDPEPIPIGGQRSVDYTNLGPGRYRLRVVAANEDGVASLQPAEVAFDIAPYWYQTLPFRATAVSLFALVGPLLYWVRVSVLRAQKAELERLVQQRTSELEAASARLAELSLQDALTGLANRRRLDNALDDEWRRALRQRSLVSVLVLDVDRFKAYNDGLGHLAGDDCLRLLAGAMAHHYRRAGELVARFGGEEFVVLLPGLKAGDVLGAGELLRAEIEALRLPHPQGGVVTVSVGGAAMVPEPGIDPSALLAAADRALYAAKAAGRNRVEVAIFGESAGTGP